MEVVGRCGLEDEGHGGVSCVNMSAQRSAPESCGEGRQR